MLPAPAHQISTGATTNIAMTPIGLSGDQADWAITGSPGSSRDQADGTLGYAAVPRADLAADAPPLCRYAKHPASLIRHQRAGSEQREPKTENRAGSDRAPPIAHDNLNPAQFQPRADWCECRSEIKKEHRPPRPMRMTFAKAFAPVRCWRKQAQTAKAAKTAAQNQIAESPDSPRPPDRRYPSRRLTSAIARASGRHTTTRPRSQR